MFLNHNHRWKTRVRVILRFGIGIACLIQGVQVLSQGLQQRREMQANDPMKQEYKQKEPYSSLREDDSE